MADKESKGKQAKTSKREAVREKRRQEQRRKRIYIVLAIVGGALAIGAIIVIPSLLPVDMEIITPVERPLADGRAMGDPEAPVIIEVYEDFQCPACKSYSEQIEPQVTEAYVDTGEVYYIFRHYPFLDDNAPRKESDQAANASMCAGDENRFWDYHDMLFANQNGENRGAFTDNRLVAFAEALGLDMAVFNQCFEPNLHADEIDQDFLMGRNSGVTGTPAVLVNGRIITPGLVPSFEQIAEAVEAELIASGN